MKNVLYIQASPRGERSKSIRVADAFIAALRDKKTELNVITKNLFETDLPEFDSVASQGKYAIMHGTEASEEVKAAFGHVVEFIEEFKEADAYVFAVPMWNFSIPYILKHYLDLVIQPTYTFKVDESGYHGLVQGKKAFISYARGGDLSSNDDIDFQKRYLELALGFMGITDVVSVITQPTLAGGKDIAEERVAASIEKAKNEAANF